MEFYNFLNFFAIFLEFSITDRVGIDRNDNFYFLSFFAFPCLFGLKRSPNSVLYFFEFFFYCFWILYYGLDSNWSERSFFFSLFLGLSQYVLARREAPTVFYNFLNFFGIFFEFSSTGRVAIDRNDNFCFLHFLAFPNLFWIEEKL